MAKHKSRKDLISEAARHFGSMGGTARRKALSAEQRREIAKKAANARWKKLAR